jgi:fructokinase
MAAKLEGLGGNRSAETRAPKIAGVGELLWDLLPGGARLGGTISNFALLCARLGNRAVLVSSVGEDEYGRTAISMLLQPNLDLQQLQVSAAHPTGTVEVTFSADNQPSYIINPGVAWDFIELTPGLLEATRDVDAICFGTLAQRHEVSRSTIRGLVEGTAPECVRVCDINIRMPYCTAEVLHWSMAHATIIKVSEEELPLTFSFLRELGLAGQPASITPDIAARFLLENFPNCRLVATTLGADGCVVTNREGTFRHPGFAIELVDTVGAGDAFTAGMLHAYLRGASLEQMAEIGNLCGSYVAGKPGAMPALSLELIDSIRALLVRSNHA